MLVMMSFPLTGCMHISMDYIHTNMRICSSQYVCVCVFIVCLTFRLFGDGPRDERVQQVSAKIRAFFIWYLCCSTTTQHNPCVRAWNTSTANRKDTHTYKLPDRVNAFFIFRNHSTLTHTERVVSCSILRRTRNSKSIINLKAYICTLL